MRIRCYIILFKFLRPDSSECDLTYDPCTYSPKILERENLFEANCDDLLNSSKKALRLININRSFELYFTDLMNAKPSMYLHKLLPS